MIFRMINRIVAAAGLALAMTSCMGVGEDLSDCAYENATITFHYTNDAGADIFSQNINSVDAFIFDNLNRLVAHKSFNQAALDEFRGWKLQLPNGDYRVLCWADIDRNSCFSPYTPGVTTLDQCTVQIDQTATSTGDHVYYAPRKTHPASRATASPGTTGSRAAGDADYEFSITAGQSTVKQMHFVRAYRALNVYVQGFSDGGRLPVIDVSNLWGQYDFLYNTLSQKFNFRQTSHAVTMSDGPAALSTFFFAFGDVIDDEVITVRKASNNANVAVVNLKEFIDQNPTAYKNDIDVLIKFNDLGVTVTIPDWKDKPVTPGSN